MTITEKMADYVLGLSADTLQPGVLPKAKQLFTDCLACMIAGGSAYTTQTALKYCVENFGSRPVAVVTARKGLKMDAYNAAFLNGIAAHVHDYDDQLPTMNGHPSAPVLPAVLAAGEETGASGMDALLAYISGVEICQALSLLLNQADHKHYNKGWHTTETFGTFGATAAAARLLGLNRQQLVYAFGMAASEASGLRANFGTMTKPFHAGRAASKGVMAAKLAKLGFDSNPEIMETEGGYVAATTGEMGRDAMFAFLSGGTSCFIDPGITIKPYPCCKCTHNGIDAVYESMKEYGFGPDDVDHIICKVMPFTIDVLKYPDAKTQLEGKFSLSYTLALTLLNGRTPQLDDFKGGDIEDKHILDYMKRIRMVCDDEIANGMYTNSTHETWVDIYLKDGRTISKKVKYSRGEARRPLSDGEIKEKLLACMAQTADPSKAGPVLEKIDALERLSDISELMASIDEASVMCG